VRTGGLVGQISTTRTRSRMEQVPDGMAVAVLADASVGEGLRPRAPDCQRSLVTKGERRSRS
jgi:hypothetical protein